MSRNATSAQKALKGPDGGQSQGSRGCLHWIGTGSWDLRACEKHAFLSYNAGCVLQFPAQNRGPAQKLSSRNELTKLRMVIYMV